MNKNNLQFLKKDSFEVSAAPTVAAQAGCAAAKHSGAVPVDCLQNRSQLAVDNFRRAEMALEWPLQVQNRRAEGLKMAANSFKISANVASGQR